MLWAPESLASFFATVPKLAPLLSRIQEQIPRTVACIGEERLRWLETLPFLYSARPSVLFTPAQVTFGALQWPVPAMMISRKPIHRWAQKLWSMGTFTSRSFVTFEGLQWQTQEASASPMTETGARLT